jgi:two-component system KDP operon response regulator KdpE
MIVSEGVRIRREEHPLLVRSGYSVIEAQYGEDALLKLRDGRPDLILLDLDMVLGRRLDVCREIRSETSAPIIMLSAQNGERVKVFALDSGVDDYIVKPIGVQELLARVRAALRRANSTGKPEMSSTFESGDLKIDFDRRSSGYGRETQYLRVFIRQLRRKLESNPSQPELICTEPWLGYRFETQHLAARDELRRPIL